MGTLLDLASLVVVPSGYKEDKIYSVVPTDGSGDLDFTRASDATRVNSAGLIEKVRENLFLQSNSFDTTWISVDTTETSGQAGYDGTNNAWLLDIASGSSTQRMQQAISASGSLTLSIYAKAGTKNWTRLFCASSDGTSNASAYFDLQNGALGGAVNCTSKIEAAGNGYYRCSVSLNTTITNVRIYVATGDGNITQASGNILIQDAQIETGDIATPYIPTTTAAVSVGMTADVPRLDYLGSSCPSLLLEPQRTNLVTFSEQFDNAAYTKVGGAVVANNAISPDGYSNADTFTADGANSTHRFFQTLSATSGTAYTASFFVKKGTADFVQIAISGTPFGGTNFANFNISTGVVGTTGGNQVNNTITDYGNGWYRISSTITATATASGQVDLCIVQASNSVRLQSWTSSASVIVYGCQLEAATYPTSYIPTLGTSVTRVADAASKTGISSLIGQTEGTAFADLTIEKPTSGNADFLLLENTATPTDGVYVLFMFETGQIGFFSYPSAGFDYVNSVDYSGQRIKVAYAYSSAGLVIYINGSQVYSSGSVSLGTGFSTFGVNNPTAATISTKVSQTLIFPTRLSNTELAQLTTI